MNFLNGSGDYIKKSPFIIPIFVVIVIAFIISIATTIEDYSTSMIGYQELPTRKANDFVVPLVAALPQVLQIVMAYVFLTENKRPAWAFGIAAFAHVVDVGLDVFYKTGGSWSLVPLAIAETELVYTFGSEFLLTFSFGLIVLTFPDFLQQTRAMFVNVIGVARDIKYGNNLGTQYRGPQQPQKKQQQQPQRPQPPRPNINNMPPNIDKIISQSKAQQQQERDIHEW